MSLHSALIYLLDAKDINVATVQIMLKQIQQDPNLLRKFIGVEYLLWRSRFNNLSGSTQQLYFHSGGIAALNASAVDPADVLQLSNILTTLTGQKLGLYIPISGATFASVNDTWPPLGLAHCGTLNARDDWKNAAFLAWTIGLPFFEVQQAPAFSCDFMSSGLILKFDAAA